MMNPIGHRARTLALAGLTAICLVAFTGSDARAAGEMRVSGKKLATNETLKGTAPTYLVTVLFPIQAVIHCKEIETHWEWLWSFPFMDFKELYRGCITLIGANIASACKPAEPVVLSARAVPILHSSKNYLLVEPSSGTSFGTFELGPECSLGEKFQLTGSYVLECLSGEKSGDCAEELVTHEVKTASGALFEDKTKFGALAATVERKESAVISGAHTGEKWSIVS